MSDVRKWPKGLRNMAIFLNRTISTSICSGKLTSRYSRIRCIHRRPPATRP
jgi:hypothetical protein